MAFLSFFKSYLGVFLKAVYEEKTVGIKSLYKFVFGNTRSMRFQRFGRLVKVVEIEKKFW